MSAAIDRGKRWELLQIENNKNDNTNLTPLPVDPSKLYCKQVMFTHFLYVLFSFPARKFPAKYETQEPREIILECTTYIKYYMYTIYSTLNTTCYILYTIYYILYTIYYILYMIYYILCTIYYILYTLYYILYMIYYIIYTIYYILYTIYYILYTVYYILFTIYFILYTIYYILYTIYLILYTI